MPLRSDCLPSVSGDAEGLVAGGVDLLNKAAGVEAHHVVPLLVEQWITEVEFFLCAGCGHVEETAFFLDVTFVDGALDGEESVAQSENKDDGKLKTLGLVNRGQAQTVLLFLGVALVALGGEEDKLGEQFFHRLIALGKADEGLQIVLTLGPVGVKFADEGGVPAVESKLYDILGRGIGQGAGHFAEGLGEGGPFFAGIGRHFFEDFRLAQNITEIFLVLFRELSGEVMNALGALRADLREEGGKAGEGGEVSRVGGKAQLGAEVLDVGLFKEAHAAGNLIVDIVAGQLHLQFHRVVVGAVEHGDVGEIAALVDQGADALENKASLSTGIHDRDEVRLVSVGAHGAQFFIVALAGRLVAEHGIGEVKDLRGAAVVRLDLVYRGLRMALIEAHDIFEVGSAPGVDALSVVAHRHDLMVYCDGIDDFGLQTVGVLKLIDQNMAEALLVEGSYIGVLLEQFEEVFQQVIIIGYLLFQLHLPVGLVDLGDFVGQTFEKGEFLLGQGTHCGTGVAGVADAIGEVLGLGVVLRLDELRVDLLDGVLEDRFGLALVENRVVAL